MKSSVLWFVAVGTAATIVHFSIVVALVSLAEWNPLAANTIAWCMAFALSFFGHWRFSFGGHRVPLWRSASRFFAVSAAGFIVNQVAYALMLQRSGWGYASSLAAVLAGVAVATYVVSRSWAFRTAA